MTTKTTTKSMQATTAIEPLESRRLLATPTPGTDTVLTRGDVERILGRAMSQALPTQIVTVVDRQGLILGIAAGPRAKAAGVRDATGRPNPLLGTLAKSVTRARTGAFFQSSEDAFSTRTARYIIQDQFPFPVPNTNGGPLYGVQFSSLPTSDVVSGPAISGDPGGVPLFKDGVPVGGIGVAGDRSDVIARPEFVDLGFYDPKVSDPDRVHDGSQEEDFDEAVALAGARGFEADEEIEATKVFIDGLRFPYLKDEPADENETRSLDDLLDDGDARLLYADANATGLTNFEVQTVNTADGGVTIGRGSARPRGGFQSPYPQATFGGVEGELKNPAVAGFGTVGSNDHAPESQRLTRGDVNRIISDATKQALTLRAAIRRPTGVPVIVHIAVTDRDGDILGVFRMGDGTIFSYDVAVQKARTAAFFSNDSFAISSRAVGFQSQQFFPPGQSSSRRDDGPGPMFNVQAGLSLGALGGNFAEQTPRDPVKNPLRNGITIFPGGVPLYKDGVLVGAIGVSGDGVDQDDSVAFSGSRRYRPPERTRSDEADPDDLARHIRGRVEFLFDHYVLFGRDAEGDLTATSELDRETILSRYDRGFDDVRLPYVKFTRNDEL